MGEAQLCGSERESSQPAAAAAAEGAGASGRAEHGGQPGKRKNRCSSAFRFKHLLPLQNSVRGRSEPPSPVVKLLGQTSVHSRFINSPVSRMLLLTDLTSPSDRDLEKPCPSRLQIR